MACRKYHLVLAALLLTAAAPPGTRLLDDLRTLSADNMAGRYPGSPGALKARAHIAGRLAEIGLAPAGERFEQPFTATDKRGVEVEGANLVAVIPGTSASDRVLVIGAHYDHLGVRNGEIYNGADDNASGVAAVLSIAESLKARAPLHTVVIALWDAEERGSLGAAAFLQAPPVAPGRIALNLNLDMMARGDRGELYVAGAAHYPFLRPRLERLAASAPVTLKLGHDGPPWTGTDDWTAESDHREFHRLGIPFVYFGVEDHPDYHRPTDDFARVPQDFFRRSAETVEQAARLLDRELDAIAAEAGSR